MLPVEYPDTVPCNKTSQLRNELVPCNGVARKCKAPIIGNEKRGPWYGCPICACLAQYEDFLENISKR
jgi:hypothetical protein